MEITPKQQSTLCNFFQLARIYNTLVRKYNLTDEYINIEKIKEQIGYSGKIIEAQVQINKCVRNIIFIQELKLEISMKPIESKLDTLRRYNMLMFNL